MGPVYIPSLLYANSRMRCKTSTASNQAIQNVIGVLAAVLKGKTVDTFQVILSFKRPVNFHLSGFL